MVKLGRTVNGKLLIGSGGKICEGCCSDICGCCNCFYTLSLDNGECFSPPVTGGGQWLCLTDLSWLINNDNNLSFTQLGGDTYNATLSTSLNDTFSMDFITSGGCLSGNILLSADAGNTSCFDTVTASFTKVYCPDCCGCLNKCYSFITSGGSGDCTGGAETDCDYGTVRASTPFLDCTTCIGPNVDLTTICFNDPNGANYISAVPDYSFYVTWSNTINCSAGDIIDYVGVIDNIGTSICPVPGTYEINPYMWSGSPGGYNQCPGPKNMTIAEVCCCFNPDVCYNFEVTYPNDPGCVDCDYTPVYTQYSGDFGYECLNAGGFIGGFIGNDQYSVYTDPYYGLILHVENLIDCSPFYGEVWRQLRVDLAADCTIPEGTYTLPWVYADGTPLSASPCIDDLTMIVTQVPCLSGCDESTTYSLSGNFVYTQHSSATGSITNCDGTGYDTIDCNTTATITGEPMITGAITNVCSRISTNQFSCYFPSYGTSYINLHYMGDRWRLEFGIAPEHFQSISTRIDASPIGIYPDVTLCFNDGYLAYELSITNLEVTL